MPSYKINLNIMPIPSVLDPQGEAIENSLKNSSNPSASRFRVGKKITFTVRASNKRKCKEIVKDLCQKLLVNEVIEEYSFEIYDEKN